MFRLSRRAYDLVIFDLDGVVTRTAEIHAAAWKELFDDFLRRRAAAVGAPGRPEPTGAADEALATLVPRAIALVPVPAAPAGARKTEADT